MRLLTTSLLVLGTGLVAQLPSSIDREQAPIVSKDESLLYSKRLWQQVDIDEIAHYPEMPRTTKWVTVRVSKVRIVENSPSLVLENDIVTLKVADDENIVIDGAQTDIFTMRFDDASLRGPTFEEGRYASVGFTAAGDFVNIYYPVKRTSRR